MASAIRIRTGRKGYMISGRKTGLWLLALFAAILVVATFLWFRYVRVPMNVAYVTEEDDGISVIDLSSLRIVRRVHPADVAPRGIGVTFDGKYIITADKDTADVAVFSTPRLSFVTRMHIGDNPEFIKIDPTGERLFATFEPGSEAGPPKESAVGDEEDDNDATEPPAQVASFHTGDWAAGPVSTAGKETEGLEFSPDRRFLLVANEAMMHVQRDGVDPSEEEAGVAQLAAILPAASPSCLSNFAGGIVGEPAGSEKTGG